MSTQTTSTTEVPIMDTYKKGWEVFKKKWGYFYLLMIVTMIASSIPSMFTQDIIKNGDTFTVILIQLIIFVWSSAVSLGMMYATLKISREQETELGDLLKPLPYLGKYILTTFILSLLVGAGFLLLIIPGIYFALKYAFVPYLIADKGVGMSDSMRMSAEMTKGIKIQLIFFIIAGVVLNILGMLPLFLGLLITIPVTTLAFYHLYNYLLPRAVAPARTK